MKSRSMPICAGTAGRGSAPPLRGSAGLICAACMGISCREGPATGNAAAHSSTVALCAPANCVTVSSRGGMAQPRVIAKVSAENALKPTTPKPPAPSAVAPGAAVPGAKPPVSTKLTPGAVSHDAQGKGILMWAAVTARHLALTTSQVLRRLDHSELSLDETAPRGKPSLRPTQLPGGGANPYESAPRSGRGAKNSTVIKGAGA